jgi:GNAT superfamily N-acetyltransferase
VSHDAITYRRATEADAHDTFQVFRLAINDFNARSGQPLVADRDDQSPFYLHMMRHDGERFWVAERKRKLVAFGAGLLRDHWWFLSSLFVLPQAQGLGIGRELLERAMTGMPQRALMATITDATQPVSNTLYARHGVLPWLPLVSYRTPLSGLRLRRGWAAAGGPAPAADPLPPDLRPERLTEANVGELRDIDMAVLGFDRRDDHRFLVGSGSRRGWLFRRAGLPAAYAMFRENGWLGPLACVAESDLEPVLRFCLAAVAAERPAVLWTGVPSVNVVAQRVLLGAGFVYEAPPALLLASRAFGDLRRYLPASFGMM